MGSKKKAVTGISGLVIASSLIGGGFMSGTLKNIQRNNVVNKQRAEDYERHLLCITMNYSEYKNTPEKKEELEGKIENKEYETEYELFKLESDLNLIKSSIKNSDGILGRAKSCIENAEEYEKEHNIEISQEDKDFRERILNTKYKDGSLNFE